MLRALLVRLPVHARRALIVDLHAIAAAVALARIRIAREDHGQRDEAAAILAASIAGSDIRSAKSCRAGSRPCTARSKPSWERTAPPRPASAAFSACRSGPSGMRISQKLRDALRPPSPTESTSSASSIWRMLAKLLISTGIRLPLGFSNSSAGPSVLHRPVGELGDLEIRDPLRPRSASALCCFSSACDEVAQVAIGHRKMSAAYVLL